jgi:hypothetical protein
VTTDRLIAILGVILGVPAFLALFVESAHRREAILTVIIVTLVLAYRAVVYYQNHLPPLSALEVRKHYAILDVAGTTATFEGTKRMKANSRGISEYWHRNISQDGSISEIKVDGRDPATVDVSCGTASICTRFDRPLEKGEEITTVLTYRLRDSFTNPSREGVTHVNSSRAKLVTMVVDLPRACNRAELTQSYAGEQSILLEGPKLSNGNRKLEAKIKKPLLGASYHLDWYW